VKGFVDDRLRALVRVPVSASARGARSEILVWIDTAFNGGLAIPRKEIANLGLVNESSAEAVLADGNLVQLLQTDCTESRGRLQ
jgi:predicted aspartyl protease